MECMWCPRPATWEVRKRFPDRVSVPVHSCDTHLSELFRMVNKDGTTEFMVKRIGDQ